MAQAGSGGGLPDRLPPGRRRAPRLGVPGAAGDRRGGAQVRPAARRRRHLQPGAGHRHGRGRPRRAGGGAADRRLRAAAGRPRRAPGRRGQPRRALPQVPRRPGAVRAGGRADEGRRDRVAPLPAQPARRAGPADRRDRVRAPADRRRGRRAGPPVGAVRRAAGIRAARRPRHAGRPLPLRRVRRAAPPAHLGPGHRHPHRPRRRPAAGRHQRRHHPRPRPVRRLPGRRARGTGGRRVGELDEEMVYESRVGDVFLLGSSSWRIEDITARPRAGQPRARPAREDAVLEGRRPRPAAGARPGARRLPARGRLGRAGGRLRPGAGRPASTSGARPTCWPTSPSRSRPPATCPTTARCSSSASATSSATGGWSCTRPSARRSTPRGRWSWPPGCASATAWTSPPCTPTTASCCGCPTPPGSRPRPTWPSSTPTTSSAR